MKVYRERHVWWAFICGALVANAWRAFGHWLLNY